MMLASNLNTYVSARGRAQWLVRLLALVAILMLVGIISDLLEIGLLNRIIAGDNVTVEDIKGNDNRQRIVGILQVIVVVSTFILYFVWIYRAYRNLSALTTYGSEHSAKWAFWGWVIPIINLYRPYQIVREIWRETIPRVAIHSKVGETEITPPLIKWWWGVWIVAGGIDRTVGRLITGAETVEALRSATWIAILSAFLTIVAAVLALQVVKLIDEQQEARYQRLRAEQTEA